ncbi:hypothetical protein [Paenibacillus sp. KN14-4R]|uniref:hypothetical protein n=1 Tax=Paenibacillus sp. KN14-4R TaxID=3445773 RepID=UPI003FA012F3
MEKNCLCGNQIHIALRTIVFQSKLEIQNVPVYSCKHCGSNEVYPIIKEELKSIINQYVENDEISKIYFEDKSEIVALLLKHNELPVSIDAFRQLMDERTNELLDMLLLAQSLQDTDWIANIHLRLTQINEMRLHPDLSAI